MKHFVITLVLAGLMAPLAAQTGTATRVIPDLGTTGVSNNRTSYPWNRTTNSSRLQYLYDASEFRSGLTITIKEIRFRPEDATATTTSWTGGTYTNVVVRASTATITNSTITSTFAANHGTDLKQCYSGAVTITPGVGIGPGVPSKNYVSIKFQNNFTYDPSKGGLLLDIATDGSSWTGSSNGAPFAQRVALQFSTTRPFARVLNTSSHTAVSGTVSRAFSGVVELVYDFNATIVDFESPNRAAVVGQQVSFMDKTLSSGQILSYSWDLDGDGSLGDATGANPTWTYTKAGVYDITLQVIARQGAGRFQMKKTGYVVIADAIKDRVLPDLLGFQFNEPRGLATANSATGTTAPREGVLSGAGWQGDPGRSLFSGNEKPFGALGFTGKSATNWVDTKWAATLSGNTTIMWWQRLRTDASDPLAYPAGGSGGMRLFVRGPNPGGLAGVAGATGLPRFETNLDIGKKDEWIHLALVIDDTNGQAYWYANGVQKANVSYTSGTFSSGAYTALRVGRHTNNNTMALHYDMDDFRIYGSALTQRQVIASSQTEAPAVTPYGVGCDSNLGAPVISTTGGLPTPGNSNFAVTLSNASANTGVILALGYRHHLGGTLPLDISNILSTGCQVEVATDALFAAATNGSGQLSFPLAIPNVPGIPGFHAYVQFAFVGPGKGAVTRALDVNIQR